jgi:hypothetical protein
MTVSKAGSSVKAIYFRLGCCFQVLVRKYNRG